MKTLWALPVGFPHRLMIKLLAGFAREPRTDCLRVRGLPQALFAFRRPDDLREIFTHRTLAVEKPVGLLPKVKWILEEGSYIRSTREDWGSRALRSHFSVLGDERWNGAIAGAVDRLVGRVRQGPTVGLFEEMGKLVSDITYQGFLSHELGSDLDWVEADTREMVRSFADALPLWLPTPGNLRFRARGRRLWAYLDALIGQRAEDSPSRRDFLEELKASNPQARALRGEALSVIFGAHTMAVPLTWMVISFCRFPRYLEALRGSLHWARLLFLETTRLYPPGWVYPRFCAQGCQIGGVELPAGSMIFPLVYLAQRDPESWADPHRFFPERFETTMPKSPFAYFPFGAGPRKCPGFRLAPHLCEKILQELVARLNFQLLGPPEEIGLHFGFELVPDRPIGMRFSPRAAAFKPEQKAA